MRTPLLRMPRSFQCHSCRASVAINPQVGHFWWQLQLFRFLRSLSHLQRVLRRCAWPSAPNLIVGWSDHKSWPVGFHKGISPNKSVTRDHLGLFHIQPQTQKKGLRYMLCNEPNPKSVWQTFGSSNPKKNICCGHQNVSRSPRDCGHLNLVSFFSSWDCWNPSCSHTIFRLMFS